tara:strand:+ start:84 stop:455 length:372 start_codon:yes stop_codon:yes gene_type:complete
MKEPSSPYTCPKDHGHNRFTAQVIIRGSVEIDRYGTILNLEEVLGCELPITRMEPDKCVVCDSPLVGGPTWHREETRDQVAQRIINDLALDEDEQKDFNIEDYRCGICYGLYDKCDCAKTGRR